MSDDDNKEPDKIARITFIVRKDDENVSPEEQEQLRRRLEQLFSLYLHGRMNQDISGLEPRNKHPVRRRKKMVIPPYPTVACESNNRPPFKE